MKELMTKQNLMFVGIGLATAVVFYNILVNREKASVTNIKPKPSEEKSSFCGCGA
jgi:hypothetical protein